ncbi:hypothetical protein [Jeotgalibacillus proteolyticus]|uniref:Uncharacterized protein n=1 Tax=Jeotgalibacillus proteolyticus TaxID=2082395 RepID=A0A2S5G8M2_9BACL|nr:hypothetical protein [Jeotgalibacillus proteolyticus]PPA69328.1 hypothetical protein C4B60_16150 [Jeotgalibacillus proteolyticus]
MINFKAFEGTVIDIRDFVTGQNNATEGCDKFISVVNDTGSQVNFVVTPSTYFVDHTMVSVGDRVNGYYDANTPVIMIYPPQYAALVMVKNSTNQQVKADFFNAQLISSDGQLQLTPGPYTQVLLANGQAFSRSPANRNLIVVYGPSTKSIPAQTTPYRIIVWCG